jgi:hypothetical protein
LTLGRANLRSASKRHKRDEIVRPNGRSSRAPPFEEFAQFINLPDSFQRRPITRLWNDTGVLIFNFAAVFFDLLEHYPDRLQNIEWFESGDHHGFLVVLSDKSVGCRSGHHGNVTGSKKAVEMQVGTIKDRFDGWDDRDVVAENGEVFDPLALGLQHGERGRRHRRLKANAEKYGFALSIAARER